jgi:hypothetical protein
MTASSRSRHPSARSKALALTLTVIAAATFAIVTQAHAQQLNGGSGIVSATGQVGPLVFGAATAVAVQRFAGQSDFIGTGTFQVPGKPTFIALGYDCTATPSPLRIDPTAYRKSGRYCRTVYFVSTKTQALAAFWTSSPAFHTKYGTHPGSSQAAANAREDADPVFPCHSGLERGTPEAELIMENRGGHPREQTRKGITYTTAVVGGVVNDLSLEASYNDVGLQFC